MRFTDEFGVARKKKKDDWFDLECTADTPLYVDPFLVFDDSDPFWSGARDELTRFFGLAMSYVAKSGSDEKSAHWRKAERMLTFPEPKEFALGLAMGHPAGAGTGPEFAQRMATALDLLHTHSISTVNYVEAFTLFCDGMGLDRISDAFCNITKSAFIQYTAKVAKRHSIPTRPVLVEHASWNRDGRWNDLRLELPKSPVTAGGILLIPERFLKDIPRVTPDGFWSWAEGNAAEVLRDDLNYDLHESLNKGQRAAAGRSVARARPEIAIRYVESIQKNSSLLPYDVEKDPKLLVGWAEAGRHAAAEGSRIEQPRDEADFTAWVKKLAEEFRAAVEDTDLWKVLWNETLTKHRDEKIVQAVAGAMWVQQCKAVNVDISKEPNMGRGPVDFKFSAGWSKRALIEVKLIGSSKFFQGAEKQLPQYLRTERITSGFYLCVGFADADFTPARLERVRETCKALGREKGVQIEPIIVDARHNNKPSGSKIK